MRKKSLLLLAGFVSLVFLLSYVTDTKAQVARGWDFSVSAFGGAGIPYGASIDTTNLPTTYSGSPGRFTGTLEDVALDTAFSFGGKLTAWTTVFRPAIGLDFGLEIDGTLFSPDVAQHQNDAHGAFTFDAVPPPPPFAQTVSPVGGIPVPNMHIKSVIPALNLLVRYPFGVSERFPNGWFQYYLGGGVGASITKLDISTLGDDKDTTVAVQALAGVKWMFHRNVGVFFEYKFTHADHSFDISGATLDLKLNVNHVLGGLAVHF